HAAGQQRPALGLGTVGPVAFTAHVADLRVAIDRADRQQVDHGLGAALVAQLEVRAAAQRVVRAGIDADAAQDATALVDVVPLEDARLGHERSGWARFSAAAA